MASPNPRNYLANEAGLRELTKKHGTLAPGPEFFFGPSTVVIQAPFTDLEEEFAADLKAWTKQADLDGNILCRQIIGAWRFDFEHGLREPWSSVESLLLDVWHERMKYEDLMWKVENESTKLMTEQMVEYYFDHLGSWVDDYEAAVRQVEICAGIGPHASPGVALSEQERQSLASCISSLDSGFRSTDEAVDPSNDRRFKLRREELLVIDKAISEFFVRHEKTYELPFEVITQDIYKSWLYAQHTSSLQLTTRQEIVEFHKWISSRNPSPSDLRKRLLDCRRFLIGAIRKERQTLSENNPTDKPFLDLIVNLKDRTVQRIGFDVAPVDVDGKGLWPLFMALFEAKGDDLTTAQLAKLPGEVNATARRAAKGRLKGRLEPLDVTIPDSGWRLVNA